MGNRLIPFVTGEWYHCYSRGIDKCLTFLEESDWNYFLESAHISNRVNKLNLRERRSLATQDVWCLPKDEPLVSIVAYCLMPNHFHLLLQEAFPGGISTFMQRLGTSYAMYFNKKYSRSGGLFTSPFRSRHINNDRYLKTALEYIHLNPLGLLPDSFDISDKKLLNLLDTYAYSSFPDYRGAQRPQGALINRVKVKP